MMCFSSLTEVTQVFMRKSAPASAALSAISWSKVPRSTTYAFVTPASKERGSPVLPKIFAPDTVR